MTAKASDEFREVLNGLANGNDLSREQAACAMSLIMEGKATPAQIGAFLMGLSLALIWSLRSSRVGSASPANEAWEEVDMVPETPPGDIST